MFNYGEREEEKKKFKIYVDIIWTILVCYGSSFHLGIWKIYWPYKGKFKAISIVIRNT